MSDFVISHCDYQIFFYYANFFLLYSYFPSSLSSASSPYPSPSPSLSPSPSYYSSSSSSVISPYSFSSSPSFTIPFANLFQIAITLIPSIYPMLLPSFIALLPLTDPFPLCPSTSALVHLISFSFLSF